MTYQIAFDNTGLETESQLDKMVELMLDRGYAVERARSLNSTNGMYGIECPVNDQEWMELLELASQA